MDFLLLQSTPAHGGAGKANRALLVDLAELGHRCHLLAPTAAVDVEPTRAEVLADLGRQGIVPRSVGDDAVVYEQSGVEVQSWFAGFEQESIQARLREVDSDWILVSEDDPALTLLTWTLALDPSRAVLVSHTPLMLPFGPDCFLPKPAKVEVIRKAAGVLTPSLYVRDYFQRWAGIEAQAVRFPVYGRGPFPRFGSFDAGLVTIVNPCAVKGISIFVGLARDFPELAFAAVPTWGTTRADRAALAALPNVRLLPPVADIDEIFARTRVLLVPSIWGEAFGQIALEAMLRGIPVVASDSGGLPEAKLGTDYALPVRTIERYQRRLDERMIPIPLVPAQDMAPWREALARLTSDRAHYEELSAASREAALAFVASLDAGKTVERFLAQRAPAGGRLATAPGTGAAAAPAAPDTGAPTAPTAPGTGAARSPLDHLSAQKRALLSGWLERKKPAG